MIDLPELLILRHGETEWNRLGRMQGALDSPLTETGRSQARAQNALIAGQGASSHGWFTSPQGRAVETARIAAQGHDTQIVTDARLREIEMGNWTGRMRSEIHEAAPHLFEDPSAMSWYGQAPGGESLKDLASRVRSFLTDLSGPAVIVTHGITSRMMRCVALDLPLSAFAALEGGQGILYRLSSGEYERIGPDGTVPQRRNV
ncbi:histidine phosphatase family protein [Phaeobacter marinintestinus]|uniref:histidine phosphatase family protein n=1 Tax=Falsiphaeobacter marinintestinus TaxID=1492905 RepID=UPI0011B3B577|nr:histidine phosphatase family protein [Phaeobacter marinintestinus]